MVQEPPFGHMCCITYETSNVLLNELRNKQHFLCVSLLTNYTSCMVQSLSLAKSHVACKKIPHL
jgi:hypothetical protein